MSQSLTLELSDEHYQAAVSTAEAAGRTLSEWAADNLTQLLVQESPVRSFASFSPEVQEALKKLAAQNGGSLAQHAARFSRQIGPKPRPQLSEGEWDAARQRLTRHLGRANSGNPHSADNDEIDADLAREYANNHAEAA